MIKGSHHSENSKKLICEARKLQPNTMQGKHHSIKSKKLMRNSHLNQFPWNKGKCNIYSKDTITKMNIAKKGKIPTNKNVPHSVKARLLMSIARKGRPLSIAHKKALSNSHIIHPTRKFSNTKIEQKIAAELENRGFVRNVDFFQNFGIKDIKNVDFYLPKQNIVIECDGCFYHACQEHGNSKYHQYSLINDAKNTKQLQIAGYSVYRFWEHDINKSSKECINQISTI